MDEEDSEIVAQSDREGARLVALARRALEARVTGVSLPAAGHGGLLDVHSGAFVSIHDDAGELRGCLGRLQPRGALAETVVDLGAAVAHADPRFPPVRRDELPSLHLEVSVLGPERPVAHPDAVEVGRHGVIVEQGAARGLLLPQVAVEHGWDSRTFVEQTCVKAGLARDAWRHGARMYVFEADVFTEAGAADH